MESVQEVEDKFSLSVETMANWIEKGPSITNIENETNFCDSEILKNVLKEKVCVL